jgi:putative ABC transport system permease protein
MTPALAVMQASALKQGIKNLLLHKLRSVLTTLGVILGVASVIAMLAIGEGSKRSALERIRQLGSANVIIRSVKPEARPEAEGESSTAGNRRASRVLQYGLKHEDYQRLVATLPTVEQALPIAIQRQDAAHEHRRIPNARVLGTTPDCAAVKRLQTRRGRFLAAIDLDHAANVAVLTAGAAERLFNFEDPIGKALLLGSDAFRVVGVLEPMGTGTSSVGELDPNNDIYIPLSASRLRFGELQIIRGAGSLDLERTQLGEIILTVQDTRFVSQTASMARKLLERTHPTGHDYEVIIPFELLRQAEHERRIWNLVLGSIAGISLVVGGIGIMNIMLASVTERTREIGIRRALGAKRRDITFQFLVESAVLSSTGGLLGILLGASIPKLVSHFAAIDTALSWWPIVLAFGISVGIGVIFGIYPAQRAARMDPIEALRRL